MLANYKETGISPKSTKAMSIFDIAQATGSKTFAALDKKTKSSLLGNLEINLKALCPKKGKASGGRIGYKAAGAVGGTLQCGQEAFTKLVNSKNKTPAQISTIKEILRLGANAMKGLGKSLSPAEMLKLRNLVGPGAWAAMGAFEAGAIGYDTINNNTPLN